MSSVQKQPVDALARAQALSLEHSFICVAPAGSGKTELLTQRLLVLLANATQPEEILAITFTRKAAAEMRHRVLGALQKAMGPEPELAHAKHTWQLAKAALEADLQYGWQLTKNPERLQIKTFDGLCASLVKALPLQSAMGAGLLLATNPAEFYRQAADNLLAELESDGAISDALAMLLGHLDNRMPAVRDLFIALLHSRAVWLPALMSGVDVRSALERCLSQVVADHLARIHEVFDERLAAEVLAMADFAARHLPAESNSIIGECVGLNELPEPCESALPKWLAITEFLLTKNGGFRKRFTKNEGIPAKAEDITAAELKALKARLKALIEQLESCAPLGELLSDVQCLPYTRYPEKQWQLLQALVSVLPRLVAHLQVCFAAASEMDFTEMSLRADQALGDVDAPTDLALRLDHRINHILVDEFQDTSSQQMQLIEKLTAGWQVGDGRSLFCVGDAMQSIYAFRNANVGLFLRCLGHDGEPGVIGDIPLNALKLSTNFRSSETVVEWVNRTFANAFSANVDLNLGAVPYNHADAFNGANESDVVQTRVFTGVNPAEIEAEFVAEKIQQLIAAKADTTVAILGRGRRQLARILPALEARAIQYRAVDLDPLASLSAVQDAKALTQALLDPANTVAWLAVLRAPWCGLILSDLLVLRGLAGLCVFEQLQRVTEDIKQEFSADGFARLMRVRGSIITAVAEQGRKSLADRVQGLWRALGGEVVTTKHERNNLSRYWEALAEFNEAELIAKPEKLEHLMANLYALPDPDASSQVQVMTMHKSKGLEFDAVFLVGLADSSGIPESPLLRWHEQVFERTNVNAQSEWLISPIGEQGKDKDALYQWLGLQEKKRERLEACRLLYVACTRAKKQLFLSACLKPDEKSPLQVASPGANSLLASIWRQVSEQLIVRSAEAEPVGQINERPRSIQRLPANWQAEDLSAVESDGEIGGGDIASDNLPAPQKTTDSAESDWLAKVHPNETAEGVLLHELLELWLPVKAHGKPVPANWQGFYPVWQQKLKALGHTGKEQTENSEKSQLGLFDEPEEVVNYTFACERIDALLNKTFHDDSPLMRALADAESIYTEYTLMQASTNEANLGFAPVETLRIDAWWRSADGRVWLLDYKSAAPKSGEAISAFERRQAARFEERLRTYSDALLQHLAAPVTPVLYLISTQSWLLL